MMIVMMAARAVLFLLGVLALQQRCNAQSSAPARQLSLGGDLSVTYNGSLLAGEHMYFVLSDDDSFARCFAPVTNAAGEETTRFLHVELWNTEAIGKMYDGVSSQVEPRADPMLMVANSMESPTAAYLSHQSDWTWSPDNTLTDYEGYRLMRPYQHVVTQVAESPLYSDPWHITISNIEIWMKRELQYTLRVSCVVEEPCPSANITETCSGHGQCNAGTCVCDQSRTEAWGDVSCDVPVRQLQNDEEVSGAQAEGQWSYYILTVPEGSHMLLVEMERIKGDPVLFVKHQEDGFSSGGLPAVMDYESYADQDSFRSRLSLHHISIMSPKAGMYYVGVYNNDDYIKERTEFVLKARWSTSDSPQREFCPADCNGNGACVSLPTGPACNCDTGYGGELCQGRHSSISLGTKVTETLQPAEWAYYQLRLVDSDRLDDGLVVEFSTNGFGQPVLVLKRNEYPSMTNNDYRSAGSLKHFKLAELDEGDYIFGIFNMDFNKHEPMEYSFSVDANSDGGLIPFTPYMSIVLGITVSLFLCLFMSICKRLIQRHGLFGHSIPENSATVHLHMRPDGSRGVDRAIVESFPSYEYMVPEDVDEEAKGDVDSDGLPSCAVCLCSYETGEMMRKLPCDHEFHMKCIDQWLTRRNTCPMCRVSLVSEDSSIRGNNGSQGALREGVARDPQGAVEPPLSPPGSTADPYTDPSTARFGSETVRERVAYSVATSGVSSSSSSSSSAHGCSWEPPNNDSRVSAMRETEMMVISDISQRDTFDRSTAAP